MSNLKYLIDRAFFTDTEYLRKCFCDKFSFFIYVIDKKIDLIDKKTIQIL